MQANGVGGGMELASSIFYGYGAAGAGRQLIAHEMAHQYWGDAVTEADWDDVWLSEGFATYFALLYQEFADGHDAFVEGVRRSKATAMNYAMANPDSTIVHRNLADISRVIANNAQIYQGGAQVLQNIRGVVGTSTFWAGIRSYYERYMNSNATTDDFRRVMEQACHDAGDRCPADGKDLSWLFTQLLNRGGALQVQGSWTYDAASKQVQVTLDQTSEVRAVPDADRGSYHHEPSGRRRRSRRRRGHRAADHTCDSCHPAHAAAPGLHAAERHRTRQCRARSRGVGDDARDVRKEIRAIHMKIEGLEGLLGSPKTAFMSSFFM